MGYWIRDLLQHTLLLTFFGGEALADSPLPFGLLLLGFFLQHALFQRFVHLHLGGAEAGAAGAAAHFGWLVVGWGKRGEFKGVGVGWERCDCGSGFDSGCWGLDLMYLWLNVFLWKCR